MNKLLELEKIIKAKIKTYTVLSTKISKEQSMYLTFFYEPDQSYCQIRISTHQSKSSFYSNKTFIFYKNHSERLAEQIVNYLEIAPWAKFNYAEFFVLHILKSHKYQLSFYIDNTFNIFLDNSQSMVIYYSLVFGKDKHINLASDKFNNVIRKLFSTGLLSYREETTDMLQLYISNAGFTFLNYFESLYLTQYLNDYRDIEWTSLKLPSEDE